MGDERRSGPRSRAWLLLTVAATCAFATGVVDRPAGLGWDRFYDVVLYNLPYLAAAAACRQAATRVPAERLAWHALALTLVLNAAGNLPQALAEAADGSEPLLLLAHLLSLGGYLALHVALVVMLRARVHRFQQSMWLDGLMGALGSLAAGVAFFLGPYLHPATGRPAELVALLWPTMDLVLLAVLVAMAAVLGVRLDRTLLALTAALCAVCVGDLAVFSAVMAGGYTDGGPLELTWLAGVLLVVVAAHRAHPAAASPTRRRPVFGWRLLALPLVCNLASLTVLAHGWQNQLPAAAAWLAMACVMTAIVRTVVSLREVRTFHEVRQQAHTDELTGLANRRALLEGAEQVLAVATASAPAALLLLDLDGFKEVNDGLGHAAGDQLLRQVGPRLRTALREGEVLGRLGGDEFAVLLPAADLDEAQARADHLQALLVEPFQLDEIRVHVGVSIGVATAPVPAATVQELLRCADVAMYAAKSAREGVRVYVPDPRGGTGDRLRTMEELRTALTRDDELVVHLQPQVDLADGRVVGVEALVRWHHPSRGLLAPAQLLPAAEQAGLLRPLTDRVLELSLQAVAGWWESTRVPLSVNLSAANVADVDLPGKVAIALLRHGLPARALTLELVEDTLMADPERGRTVLGELRRLGIRTSIDDYGTGYSSLAYLRHLPADELKLDRSLTLDAGRDPRAAAIVKHTVALAHELGLSLVAEGVEDAATARVLADLGCDVAQGYAIARPMPVDAFLRWLEARVHTPVQPL